MYTSHIKICLYEYIYIHSISKLKIHVHYIKYLEGLINLAKTGPYQFLSLLWTVTAIALYKILLQNKAAHSASYVKYCLQDNYTRSWSHTLTSRMLLYYWPFFK